LAWTAWALGVLLHIACDPTFDPAAKADIDGRVAAIQEQTVTVPAAPAFNPLPVAAGQWSQYEIVDDHGQPSFLTYKVVGVEGDAFWVETLYESYLGPSAQKMLIAFASRTDPNRIEVRSVVTRDRLGKTAPLSAAESPNLREMFRGIAAAMAIGWPAAQREPAIVPAGRFDGCYRSRSRGQWGPWTSIADAWRHPAVPLSGLVRSQGIDHPFTMDLVAFGTTGAKPDF
jgi:hypothetical protein